jgi:hypothetical protein
VWGLASVVCKRNTTMSYQLASRAFWDALVNLTGLKAFK